jgi:hypothetical protein
VQAALFAFRSPFSKGAILADKRRTVVRRRHRPPPRATYCGD